MDLKAFFRGIKVFKNISEEDLRLLVSNAVVEDFGAGDVIVKQGASGDSIWFLIKGEAEVVQNRDRAGKVSLAVLGANDYFGEISVLTGTTTTAEVVACDSVRAVRIPGGILTDITDSHFSTMAEFTNTIVKRLSDNLRKK